MTNEDKLIKKTPHNTPMGGYSPDPVVDTGWGTTPGQWEMVSEALDGVQLTEDINKTIYALCEGRAKITAQ